MEDLKDFCHDNRNQEYEDNYLPEDEYLVEQSDLEKRSPHESQGNLICDLPPDCEEQIELMDDILPTAFEQSEMTHSSLSVVHEINTIDERRNSREEEETKLFGSSEA